MDARLTRNAQDQMEESTRRSISDIICEFLEVAFNLILYVRKVYPDGIFRKCQKYNVAVMMNCHPELRDYIKDVLIGIRSLLRLGNVERVTLQLMSEERPVERYVFEVQLPEVSDADIDCGSERIGLEQRLRDLLLKIHTSDAVLTLLPPDCSFIVMVQTKESVANEMVHCEHFEGFPWVKSDNSEPTDRNAVPTIVPLKSCSTQLFDLQCFVETNISFAKK